MDEEAGTAGPGEGVDPVATPSAYREMLLSWAGDGDPAEVQEASGGELRSLIARAGERLRQAPAPGEWSAVEVLGHIADAELVGAARYRWILAHDRPALAPYEQDDWVERLDHRSAPPDELLDLFEALRRANLALWRRTPEADRARLGIHAERGPESYETTFRMIAGHDRVHLDQLRRTVEAVEAMPAGRGGETTG
ncbi:MAG: DinB family protein [Actinobacteria bacterium]|nr:DinB family protein [Actinomycetota bacterium]